MAKNDILVLNEKYLKDAGIEISNAPDAATKARAQLRSANGTKGYIPENPASDTAIKIADYVRQELSAGENAMKHVCIGLASLDLSGEYANAHDKNGKPYTSMLSFAMDLLPNLAKSTVAGYMAVGKNIYVPAIRKRFGASSSILLELPPSTLDSVKANLSNDDLRGATIEAIKAASKNGGNVTQRLAKSIAKIVRDASGNKTLSNLTAANIVKAAKGDTPTLKLVYPEEQEKKTGGATANGGNKEAVDAHNNEEYNAVKAAILSCFKPKKSTAKSAKGDKMNVYDISMDADSAKNFTELLRRSMVSSDENAARYVCRAIAEIMDK